MIITELRNITAFCSPYPSFYALFSYPFPPIPLKKDILFFLLPLSLQVIFKLLLNYLDIEYFIVLIYCFFFFTLFFCLNMLHRISFSLTNFMAFFGISYNIIMLCIAWKCLYILSNNTLNKFNWGQKSCQDSWTLVQIEATTGH